MKISKTKRKLGVEPSRTPRNSQHNSNRVRPHHERRRDEASRTDTGRRPARTDNNAQARTASLSSRSFPPPRSAPPAPHPPPPAASPAASAAQSSGDLPQCPSDTSGPSPQLPGLLCPKP
ncbi:hypothetical protein GQ55_3G145900 [Panicum hallii var. hallii]|uniref:Uncharacterized protein n=1 Tax=Panicum hallii var. hallii TaxID=1504633 RepID=A0A2T7E9F6_9POAL|nr:hypothetical protein GQ55_3G145900 [Panicum hallii var. hallii]